MGGCCDKRGNSSVAKIENQVAKGGGITSDEIPKVIEYIGRYFTQNPDHEIIAVNISKD